MTARHVKSSPRKRPTQSRAALTVESILHAAAAVFEEHGFEGASVNRIAARAGVSVGSLYQYFPSKEAILIALAERHTGETLTELERVLDEVRAAPLEAAVRAAVAAMIAAHEGPLASVLARGLDELGTVASVERAIQDRAVGGVERFLRDRRDLPNVDDHALTALFLVRAIDLLTHTAIEHDPETLRDGRLADELTALALGYLRTERTRG